MMNLQKDMLRESLEICRQSNLYSLFTRAEKREAVMHVYGIISGSGITADETLSNQEECKTLCR